MPLAVVGAMTQGQIGYIMEAALTEALARAGVKQDFATLVTNTIVDANDPGFKKSNQASWSFLHQRTGRRPYLPYGRNP